MKLKPVMRTDEHHIEKHQQITSLKNKEEYNVVFLGDSLTRRWEDNIQLWNEYFTEYKPLNLGVGGDCIENVLWRIENGELDKLNPELFIVLIGTNNITAHDEMTIANGVLDVVAQVKERCPAAKIVLSGLLPREQDEAGNECNAKIGRINAHLSEIADQHEYHYEYYGDKLLAEDGRIDKDIMPDGLHLNEDGYRIAGPIIKQIIQKHLN